MKCIQEIEKIAKKALPFIGPSTPSLEVRMGFPLFSDLFTLYKREFAKESLEAIKSDKELHRRYNKFNVVPCIVTIKPKTFLYREISTPKCAECKSVLKFADIPPSECHCWRCGQLNSIAKPQEA